uniref:Uncharacterized protein n=1 Tax=Nothoprocta perdicaria TaxID=30464 RepID=A0A8C6ZX12_NOTPE
LHKRLDKAHKLRASHPCSALAVWNLRMQLYLLEEYELRNATIRPCFKVTGSLDLHSLPISVLCNSLWKTPPTTTTYCSNHFPVSARQVICDQQSHSIYKEEWVGHI